MSFWTLIRNLPTYLAQNCTLLLTSPCTTHTHYTTIYYTTLQSITVPTNDYRVFSNRTLLHMQTTLPLFLEHFLCPFTYQTLSRFSSTVLLYPWILHWYRKLHGTPQQICSRTNPQNMWLSPYLEKGSYRYNYVKHLHMTSPWISEVGPNCNTSALIRDTQRRDAGRRKKGSMCREAETEVI